MIRVKNIRNIGLLVIMSVLFIGCMSSSHHFRKGELLKSGESEINWGYSYTKVPFCRGATSKKDGFTQCEGDAYYRAIPNVSRSFRLGVRDEWWIFEGVEIGYQFESSQVLQFDMRLGLPKSWLGAGLEHAVGLGWGIGQLPDNTYFMDYALSRRWNKFVLYTSLRESLLTTQIVDLGFADITETNSDLYIHARRWLTQMSFGAEFDLGDIYIIPDQINVEILLSTPEVPFVGNATHKDAMKIVPQLNMGMGWHY